MQLDGMPGGVPLDGRPLSAEQAKRPWLIRYVVKLLHKDEDNETGELFRRPRTMAEVIEILDGGSFCIYKYTTFGHVAAVHWP
jgi:hypothetical protein